jgi:mono/diheme cytochrome c family protein
MPAVGSNWTDDQIAALVKYTKTIVKPPSANGS